MAQLDELIAFYENLSSADIARFGAFYAEDAWFKDPFNEVRGLPAIKRIFGHMFGQVVAPRFRVEERIVADNGAVLVWTFHFRSRRLAGGGWSPPSAGNSAPARRRSPPARRTSRCRRRRPPCP